MATDEPKTALAAYNARRLAGDVEAPARLDPLARARANPTSKTLAIRAKCWECVGGNSNPNWQKRVGECTIARCGIHPFRPYQRGDAEEA